MTLQEELKQLVQYDPKDFDIIAPVKPADPLGIRRVRQHRGEAYGTNSDQLFNQLKKDTLDTDVKKILEVLDKWRGHCTGKVWISDTLPADMNLPLSKEDGPNDNTLQVFFVGQHLPAFVLTVFNGDGSHDKDKIHEYTVSTAQMLNESLLDFCCDRFAVLPCTLEIQNFNEVSLQEELEEREDNCLDFYDGPIKLTTILFKNISTAAVLLQGVSSIPCLMPFDPQASVSEDKLPLLFDQQWRNVVHLLITCLTHADLQSVTSTCNADWKMKVAMLEAARRVGRRDQVTIQSSDPMVSKCVKKLCDQDKCRLKLEDSLNGPESLCVISSFFTIRFVKNEKGIAKVTVIDPRVPVSEKMTLKDKACVHKIIQDETGPGSVATSTGTDIQLMQEVSATREICTSHTENTTVTHFEQTVKIIGVPEERQNESNEGLKEKIWSVLTKLQLGIGKSEITEVKRLKMWNIGKLLLGAFGPHDTYVAFSSQDVRDRVFQHREGLKDCNPPMYIEEYLPGSKAELIYEARRRLGFDCAWSENENVYVQTPACNITQINSLDDLYVFIQLNEFQLRQAILLPQQPTSGMQVRGQHDMSTIPKHSWA